MAAPLRIYRTRPTELQVEAVPASNKRDEQFDGYLARLTKLIPAEVLSFYIVGCSRFPTRTTLLWLMFVVGMLLVVVVRVKYTFDEERKSNIQWSSIVVSLISFAVWAYNLGGPFLASGIHDADYAAFFVLTWTFVPPILLKGD